MATLTGLTTPFGQTEEKNSKQPENSNQEVIDQNHSQRVDKSRILREKAFVRNEEGYATGTISPMIMNMVLDGWKKEINKKFPRWKNKKVNFIRYADDFVITAISKEVNMMLSEVSCFIEEIERLI